MIPFFLLLNFPASESLLSLFAIIRRVLKKKRSVAGKSQIFHIAQAMNPAAVACSPRSAGCSSPSCDGQLGHQSHGGWLRKGDLLLASNN